MIGYNWEALSALIDSVSKESGGCRRLDKETKSRLIREHLPSEWRPRVYQLPDGSFAIRDNSSEKD